MIVCTGGVTFFSTGTFFGDGVEFDLGLEVFLEDGGRVEDFVFLNGGDCFSATFEELVFLNEVDFSARFEELVFLNKVDCFSARFEDLLVMSRIIVLTSVPFGPPFTTFQSPSTPTASMHVSTRRCKMRGSLRARATVSVKKTTSQTFAPSTVRTEPQLCGMRRLSPETPLMVSRVEVMGSMSDEEQMLMKTALISMSSSKAGVIILASMWASWSS